MKHKIAAVLIVLILALMFTGVTAFAEETYSEGYFYYIEGEGCVIITGYFGREAAAYLPDHIAGLPVSEIAKGAFVGTTLSEIHLPFTVMTIQEGAFGEGITVYYDDGRVEESESTDNDKTTTDNSGETNDEGTLNDKGESTDNKDENGKSSNDKSDTGKNNKDKGKKSDGKVKSKTDDEKSGEVKHEVILVKAPDEVTLGTEEDIAKAEAFNELMDERAEEAINAQTDAEKGLGTGAIILIVCIYTLAAAGVTYKVISNKKLKEKEN